MWILDLASKATVVTKEEANDSATGISFSAIIRTIAKVRGNVATIPPTVSGQTMAWRMEVTGEGLREGIFPSVVERPTMMHQYHPSREASAAEMRTTRGNIFIKRIANRGRSNIIGPFREGSTNTEYVFLCRCNCVAQQRWRIGCRREIKASEVEFQRTLR